MDLYCVLELPHEQAVKARVSWQFEELFYLTGSLDPCPALGVLPPLVIKLYLRKLQGDHSTKVSRATPPRCHVLKRRGYVFLVRFEEAYGWALARQSPMLIAITSRSYKDG